MLKRLYQLPKYKQHIYSIFISIASLSVAVILSTVYHYTQIGQNHIINVYLIFILFILFISCSTVGYIYCILSSLFSVIWINYIYTYPYFSIDFATLSHPVTFVFMLIITIAISLVTSRLAEQVLISANQERKLKEMETERLRANLLRAISHDLRTPLSGIIGNINVYQDNINTLPDDKKREIINNIQEDAIWLYNMVENVLTITRIHNEDMTIKTNVEIVEEVIGEVVQRFTKRHPECKLHVEIPEAMLMLPMDAILIEQVTINLLENALMHSGNAERVDMIVTDYPKHVEFAVKDYGQGIPPEMLGNLFDGTSYTASHTADVKKGIGIGLVICKTIIDAHHGTISGENHEHGAVFTYTLPKA